MAAPAPQLGQGQKVMVAVDESECSRHALEWALRNLAPTLAPPLLLLTVQPLVPLGYVSAASFGAPPPELIKSMQEQQRELTQALLDKAKAICAEHGVPVETIVEVGDPKEMICEAAEKKNVDLLVLGSHSRGPIQSKMPLVPAKREKKTRPAGGRNPRALNKRRPLTQAEKTSEPLPHPYTVAPLPVLFLGSVSNYCVHHCKCPVLVVKNQG